MKLALEFGIPERELLGRMDSIEYGRWKAFFRIFPFSQDRADLRAAMIAASCRNATLVKGDKAFRIKDFLFDFIIVAKRQSAKSMMNICKLFAGVYNKSKKGCK